MRPYVEFIQSQALPWTEAPAALGGGAVRWKLLSRDPDNGAVTALLQVPAAAPVAMPAALGCAVEMFVLKGALRWGGLEFGTHHYGWIPALWPLGSIEATAFSGRHGPAIVLVFIDAEPAAAAAPGAVAIDGLREHLVGPIDSVALRWDDAGMDPNINHLNAARKNLRLAPQGDCRSYLLGGMPQGFSYAGAALETHPHVEEFFMVSGDMACHVGTMRTGAYFHRPPGIPHGRDCTRTGFLLFCRTPGSNRTISHWTPEKFPVSWHPPHAPRLPPGFEAAGVEQPDAVEY
jgi:hypothetical protein